jgi:hypothetical protein
MIEQIDHAIASTYISLIQSNQEKKIKKNERRLKNSTTKKLEAQRALEKIHDILL